MNSKEYRKYFYFKMLKDKSQVAQVLDLALLSTIIVLVGIYIFSMFLHSRFAAIFLAIITAAIYVVIVLLYRSIKLDIYIKNHIAVLHRSALLDYIMLANSDQICAMLSAHLGNTQGLQIESAIIFEKTFHKVIAKFSKEPVTASEVLSIYKNALSHGCKKAELYSTASFSSAVTELCSNKEINVILHTTNELLDMAKQQDLLPCQEAVERAIQGKIDSKLKNKNKNLTTVMLSQNAKRYMLCAFMITALSLVTGFNIYYQLISTVCMLLSSFCFYKSVKNRQS